MTYYRYLIGPLENQEEVANASGVYDVYEKRLLTVDEANAMLFDLSEADFGLQTLDWTQLELSERLLLGLMPRDRWETLAPWERTAYHFLCKFLENLLIRAERKGLWMPTLTEEDTP